MDRSRKALSIKEHQNIMLDMMIQFDKYCQFKNLRYFLAAGTLLGAVRHKGFIPWDDDVDIVMPRPDYQLLVQALKISENYEIVSIENPHDYYHPFAYCNITDKTTIINEHIITKQTGKGIFLDVFPIDGLPDDYKKCEEHMNSLLRMEIIFSLSINKAPGYGNIRDFAKSIVHFLASPLDIIKLGRKIQDKAQSYPYEDSEFVATTVMLSRKLNRHITPKDEYSSFELLDFENYKFRCPIGYENILKRLYGDFMKLPPENERSGHHGIDIYKRI